MKLSGAEAKDVKFVGQLVKMLQNLKMPGEVTPADCKAIAETIAWAESLVNLIVADWKESNPPKPMKIKSQGNLSGKGKK